MTSPTKTSQRLGRASRAAAVAVGSMFAVAGLAVGLLFGGVAAEAASPAAQTAAVVEAVPTEQTLDALVPVEPVGALPSERGVPGVGLSIFFGTALTVGAGGIVTARLLAQRQNRPAAAHAVR